MIGHIKEILASTLIVIVAIIVVSASFAIFEQIFCQPTDYYSYKKGVSWDIPEILTYSDLNKELDKLEKQINDHRGMLIKINDKLN